MSRVSTRQAAADAARKPGSDLELDADAIGPGLREWFGEIGEHKAIAAAFDTRVDMPVALSGRAGRGIERRLRRKGFEMISDPESFLVDKQNHLLDGEEQRALEWGRKLAAALGERFDSDATRSAS
jgi:hypothetical protein